MMHSYKLYNEYYNIIYFIIYNIVMGNNIDSIYTPIFEDNISLYIIR